MRFPCNLVCCFCWFISKRTFNLEWLVLYLTSYGLFLISYGWWIIETCDDDTWTILPRKVPRVANESDHVDTTIELESKMSSQI